MAGADSAVINYNPRRRTSRSFGDTATKSLPDMLHYTLATMLGRHQVQRVMPLSVAVNPQLLQAVSPSRTNVAFLVVLVGPSKDTDTMRSAPGCGRSTADVASDVICTRSTLSFIVKDESACRAHKGVNDELQVVREPHAMEPGGIISSHQPHECSRFSFSDYGYFSPNAQTKKCVSRIVSTTSVYWRLVVQTLLFMSSTRCSGFDDRA